MSGSSFGRLFVVTTFGESHGAAIGVVVDGMPPGLPLGEAAVQRDLDRRRPGQSEVSTPRSESDTVEILSGVFQGRTTGCPIAMVVRNRDVDSSDYERIRHLFRPGHADYTYQAKYGLRDWRGSGRASGRETAARVAAGAVARVLLNADGMGVKGYSREIAGVQARRTELDVVERNIVRTCDPDAVEPMVARIAQAREAGDSVGGIVELLVTGCPAGLGEPVFDKLDARLAHALMSVGAVKGVEVGAGFAAARMRGSEFNDAFIRDSGRVRTRSNNAGGVLGGISTAEDILLRCAVRPPASIPLEQDTVTVDGEPARIQVHGRHDPCIVPRVVPVLEAMAAITLADSLLIRRSEQAYSVTPGGAE